MSKITKEEALDILNEWATEGCCHYEGINVDEEYNTIKQALEKLDKIEKRIEAHDMTPFKHNELELNLWKHIATLNSIKNILRSETK